ncbi:MAG TPA: hypothetical protein PLZ36_04925 [Armatimonadota bacterium]|nr:hypothetical protein [Armatimonadota bacterium]
MVDTLPRPAPDVPLYEKHSREEEAELALKRTHIAPALAVAITALLLLTIISEPLIQQSLEIARHPGRAPQVLEIVTLLPSTARSKQIAVARPAEGRGFMYYWNTLPPVKEILAYEKALEKGSYLGQWVLPRAQALLSQWGGAGNEQAYIGRDGWLYYRPEVEYLTNDAFLNPESLKQRARSGEDAVQPNPITAIAALHAQLAARGITLVVMPAPVKPSIYPQGLSARYAAGAAPVQNPSYRRFLGEMARRGILVVDVSAALIAAQAATGTPQYLKTDTHWTPAGMALAADTLARELEARKLLPPRAPVGYRRLDQRVTNLGDIAEMFKLPASQRLLRPETVTIHPVRTPDGRPWQPENTADVLVLGDSFFNIYSLGGMRWGEGAGFVEQLSYRLRRPLDKIVINAGGSFAARQELAKRLARGQDVLAGKKVVIYEFAMRDLLVGDWKLIDLPAVKGQPTPVPDPTPTPDPTPVPDPTPDPTPTPVPAPTPTPTPHPTPTPTPTPVPDPTPAERGLVVRGTLAARSEAPQPGSVPYKDCLIALHLTGVTAISGNAPAKEIIVFVWGMRDNQWTKAAGYAVGKPISLRLKPWAEVEGRYGGYNRVELDDDALFLLDTFWGEE